MSLTAAQALDASPLTRRQVVIVALVAAALILDGLDLQLLAFAAPMILSEWGIGQAEFAPALAAALVGMTVGAGCGGYFGDRWGRKRALIVSIVVYGGATLAVSQAQDVTSLALLRLVSGFGFGAASPNAIALVTESLPAQWRARVIGLLAVALPLGGMVGAAASMLMLPALGWQMCFLVGGLTTLALAIALLAWAPESPAYLAQNGRTDRARASLATLGVEIPGEIVATGGGQGDKSALRQLLSRANWRLNLGLWLAFATMSYVGFAFVNWSPVILSMAGLDLQDALRGSFFYNFLAVVGGLLAATAIAVRGSRQVLLITAACTVGAIVLLGAILHGPAVGEAVWLRWAAIGCVTMVGFMSGMFLSALYTQASVSYPVVCRASGIGAAVTAGRLGGIIAVLSGGALLGGAQQVLPLIVALTCVAALSIVAAAMQKRRLPATLSMSNP